MGTSAHYETCERTVNCLITLAKSWPREKMSRIYPTRDCVLVGTIKLVISRMETTWAVVSYIFADVADNAVVCA